MRRAADAKFMPNSYVFPGGVVESEDGAFPCDLTNHHSDADPHSSDDNKHYSLKVGAVRELFEESGLLLVDGGEVWNAAEDSHLEAWRQKVLFEADSPLRLLIDGVHRNGAWVQVSRDASLFPQLFSSTTRMDLASLVYWSNWLTPTFYPRRWRGGYAVYRCQAGQYAVSRFDTFYFVVRTDRCYETSFNEHEMSHAEWAKPSHLIEKCCGDEPTISLPPPQWYELLRLRMAPYPKLECMANHSRILPQVVRAEDNADLFAGILPGDHLYVEGTEEEMAPQPRSMPIKSLLPVPAEQNDESQLPVHRITYTRDPLRQLDYTRHEMHIRNMEHAKQKAHLFHWVDNGNVMGDARDLHPLFARLPSHHSD